MSDFRHIVTRDQKARVRHSCWECTMPIEIGTLYRADVQEHEGRVYTIKSHIECADAAQMLAADIDFWAEGRNGLLEAISASGEPLWAFDLPYIVRKRLQDALAAAQDVLEEWRTMTESKLPPVAWMYHGIRYDGTQHDWPSFVTRPEYMDAMSEKKGAKIVPLYASPPEVEQMRIEIERLRADLAIQQGCCDGAAAQDAHVRREREEHRAEVDALRADIENLCSENKRLREDREQLHDEIARLCTNKS